jgi:hypothetical protein
MRMPYDMASYGIVSSEVGKTIRDILRSPGGSEVKLCVRVAPEFLFLDIQGSTEHVHQVQTVAKSRGWKVPRSITISSRVTAKKYHTTENLKTPTIPVYTEVQESEHGPRAYRASWINLPEHQRSYVPSGNVTYSAEYYGMPLAHMAKISAEERSKEKRKSPEPYTMEEAYTRGLETELEEAYEQVAASRSNAAGGQGGGRRRKTRKSRK